MVGVELGDAGAGVGGGTAVVVVLVVVVLVVVVLVVVTLVVVALVVVVPGAGAGWSAEHAPANAMTTEPNRIGSKRITCTRLAAAMKKPGVHARRAFP